MEIKVLENTKSRLRVEIIGKAHTLPNVISKELWNDKNVVVAGYSLDHPMTSSAVLVVETKTGDPKKALLGALSRLGKKNKDFLAAVKKVAK